MQAAETTSTVVWPEAEEGGGCLLSDSCEALWAGRCDLEDLTRWIKVDLSPINALVLGSVEQHGETLGPTAGRPHHCAGDALARGKLPEAVPGRLGELVLVTREHDPARPSTEVARYPPRPYEPTY